MTDFTLRATVGLVAGMTIQFAEGQWPGDIGEGVAVTDEAFDSIEPHLRTACPGWTPMHRYGIFDLTAPACSTLVQLLRCEGARLRNSSSEMLGKAALFHDLADWLEVRCNAGRPLSILGF